MKYLELFKRIFLLSFLVVTLSVAAPVQARQPDAPVSVELKPDSLDEATVQVTVTVSPNVRLQGGVLRIDVPRGVSLEGPNEIEVRGDPEAVQQIDLQLKAERPGEFPILFSVKASAELYEEAGTSEKRYLVIREGEPAQLVTGKERRRILRRDIQERLEESRRNNPDDPLFFGDLITGNLTRTDIDPDRVKPDRDVLLAPPAPGIEDYEKAYVVERTDEVVKALDPITVTGSIFYQNRSGSTVPLVNATVDVRDSDTGFDEQLTSVITNGSGSFSAVVDADDGWFQNGRDIYIRVRTTNSRFRVQDCAGILPDSTYSWSSNVVNSVSDGTTVNFGSLSVGADNEAAIIFQDLDDGWQFLTSAGAFDPGFVDLCWPEGASVYSTFWKEIDIQDGDEVARDIVLHEYGHATMHNAYNGFWPSNTGGAHTFDDTNQHPNFAFVEGWGTVIALAVNPDGVYNSNGWSRSIESFSTSETDGTENEGWVAAAYNDVRDTASDGGCGDDDCDPSGSNAPAFSKMWRDSFVGNNSETALEYWDHLCGELDSDEHTDALAAMDFNRIDAPSCRCTVSRVMVASAPNQATQSIAAVRRFRDLALRGTDVGEEIIDTYYAHMGEATKILMEDREAQKMAAQVFGRIGEMTLRAEKDPVGAAKRPFLDVETAQMSQELIERIQKAASPEFRSALERVRPVLTKSDGMTLDELRERMTKSGLKERR
ncbi:hypothetical protein [Roseovarius aestuariivivens]|uniref:hypothetical protein n=1 Tax=Roseovarius aestuariivivens TaxID=1888910 RepID=UPI0010811739|nr:hypothetical protein [Roseovarius aestuariivivens]